MSNTTVAAPVLQSNSGDVAWVLTSSAFVLLMTAPGLALFYGGLVNRKNVVNMMAMSSFTAVRIQSSFGKFIFSANGPKTSRVLAINARFVHKTQVFAVKLHVPRIHSACKSRSNSFDSY